MRVSVLLPSRGRREKLITSIHSLLDKAAEPDQIEVLVRLDFQDPELYDGAWHDDLGLTKNIQILIGDERDRYLSFHTFVNDLAGLARGQWMFLWNDDAFMETDGWDTHLAPHGGKALLLATSDDTTPDGRYICFPIFDRVVYDALGHVSLHPACDSWLESILRNCKAPCPEIKIRHERVIGGDETQQAIQARAEEYTLSFSTEKMEEEREEDRLTLGEYLTERSWSRSIRI